MSFWCNSQNRLKMFVYSRFFLKNMKQASCQEAVRAPLNSVKHEVMHGRMSVHNYRKSHISEKPVAPKLGFSNLLRTRSWNQVSHVELNATMTKEGIKEHELKKSRKWNWRKLKRPNRTNRERHLKTMTTAQWMQIQILLIQIFVPMNLPTNDLIIQ